MFTQLSIKDKVNQNGIGFGLTISKMIIESLGGIMKVKNHTNISKTFLDYFKDKIIPVKKKEEGLVVKILLPLISPHEVEKDFLKPVFQSNCPLDKVHDSYLLYEKIDSS